MRIIFSRRTWISAGIVCLPCLLSTGCKSTGPGLGWLSWSKPKSLATSLSSNIPTKPSVNALPPPSTTMGSTGSSIGTGTNLAGQPGGTGYVPPAGSVPNTGYNTGPYGMTGQTSSSPPGSVPSYAGAYSGAAHTHQNPGATYNAFPQQNQSAAPQAAGAYRTADLRNAVSGAPAAAYGGAATAGSSGASHNWNNEQWGRNEPRSGSQPAGYTEGLPGNSQSAAADAWSQSRSAQPAAATSYGDRFSNGLGTTPTPSSTSSSATQTPGGYRPGSTGRSAGTLPAAPATGAALPAAGSSYPAPASNYPTSSYPSTSYPSTGGAAASTANSTGYAGGYGYPSTNQMR